MEGTDTSTSSDAEEILASIEDFDRFATIVRRHFSEIFRYLARRVGPDAEDLAAETFVIAFQNRRRYDPRRPDARPWLYGIATNVIRHHRRSEFRQLSAYQRLRVESEGKVDDVAIAAAHVEAREELIRVARALTQLDPTQRDALYLVAVAGLSYEEAAEALGVKAGTLHSRVARARGNLRDLMRRSGKELVTDDVKPGEERG